MNPAPFENQGQQQHLVHATLLALLCRQSIAAEKPLITVVIADGTGWGRSGHRGHPLQKTPYRNAMAANGLHFERFSGSDPVYLPTQASALADRSHERTGAPSHGQARRTQERTIAQAMIAAGRMTGKPA